MPIIEPEKPLLIGQAPSRLTQGRVGDAEPLAFSGYSGAFLASLIGLTLRQFHSRVEAINLLHRWPGRATKGDAFDVLAAANEADRLLPRLAGRSVILVGRSVADAFGWGAEQFLGEWESDRVRWALLPHPSGVNRWWNDRKNRAAAERLLRKIILREKGDEE